MRTILTVLFSTILAASPLRAATNYCLALRGNGELAPAHWGALARLVENRGFPQAMAGGSSASISLFLLESVAKNPFVQLGLPDLQKVRASLLVKSFEAYVTYLLAQAANRQWTALPQYLNSFSGAEEEFRLRLLTELQSLADLLKENPKDVMPLLRSRGLDLEEALNHASEMGLLDLNVVTPLVSALFVFQSWNQLPEDERQTQASRIRFLVHELKTALEKFGRFDAENDANLFFRPGLINFKSFARLLGRMADFYSGHGHTTAMATNFSVFFNRCTAESKGKSWTQLVESQPFCGEQFARLIEDWSGRHAWSTPSQRLKEPVGGRIPTFPITAVLISSAYQQAKESLQAYQKTSDLEFGLHFRVNPQEVMFGYWGDAKALRRIGQGLQRSYLSPAGQQIHLSSDEKSQRFFALGETSWGEVLSLSPAEPGLAPFQEFKAADQNLMSIGGWPDLQPTGVLKAYGCEQVVLVTRRGGESQFAQSVAKRLLDEHSHDQLYNLSRAESSFNVALQLADEVVCTNWDSLEMNMGLSRWVAEGYEAPVLNSRVPLSAQDQQKSWRGCRVELPE